MRGWVGIATNDRKQAGFIICTLVDLIEEGIGFDEGQVDLDPDFAHISLYQSGDLFSQRIAGIGCQSKCDGAALGIEQNFRIPLKAKTRLSQQALGTYWIVWV